MSRSIKKGPFIDFKLEKRVLEMNEGQKEISDQDMVKKISDFS